jgi:membrane protein P13
MKIFFILSLFLILAVGTAFSQDNTNKNFLEVQILINDDLDDHYSTIKKRSAVLSFAEKSFIYDDNSKGPWGPFALNLLVGFGIGSWVQGDGTGGAIGTIGGVGGLLLMSADRSSFGPSSTAQIGAIIFLSSFIIDLILPFTHSSSYNKKLKRAIGFGALSNLRVTPTVNLAANNTVAPGIAFSLSF